MKKEKKPYSVFTVLFSIMFLAVFIILPPVCRKYFPKKEKEVEMIKSTRYNLTCSRNSASEKLKLKNVVEFKNTELLSYTLTYEMFEPTLEDIENEKTLAPLAVKAIEEMNFIMGLNNINSNKEEKKTTLIITSDALNNNNPKSLGKYFETKEEIKKRLESEGYNCKLK